MAKAKLTEIPAPAPESSLDPAATPLPLDLPETPPADPPKPKEWAMDLTGPDLVLKGKTITRIVVNAMTFAEFAKAIDRANRASMRDKSSNVVKYLIRERMKAQARAIATDGTAVTLDEAAVMLLPRGYAVKISRALDAVNGEPGELLTDTDGISAPILYRLAQSLMLPITGGGNGQEMAEVHEIEIVARTWGDVEDVVTLDGPHEQTLALLRQCAKPVGTDIPLQALPSWAVDQIGLADGLKIAQDVLPRFLN